MHTSRVHTTSKHAARLEKSLCLHHWKRYQIYYIQYSVFWQYVLYCAPSYADAGLNGKMHVHHWFTASRTSCTFILTPVPHRVCGYMLCISVRTANPFLIAFSNLYAVAVVARTHVHTINAIQANGMKISGGRLDSTCKWDRDRLIPPPPLLYSQALQFHSILINVYQITSLTMYYSILKYHCIWLHCTWCRYVKANHCHIHLRQTSL